MTAATTTLTQQQVETVQTSFAKQSANPAIRDDMQQHAWGSLLTRRTKWDDQDKLRSQSRNAAADAVRTMARSEKFDRRTILSALQWDQLEQGPTASLTIPDDLESLSSTAKLLIRIRCRKVLTANSSGYCKAWVNAIGKELRRHHLAIQTPPSCRADFDRAQNAVEQRELDLLTTHLTDYDVDLLNVDVLDEIEDSSLIEDLEAV